MKVLVDTSVWSLALRRTGTSHPFRSELEQIIQEGRVAIIGAIRQEILSGVKTTVQFEQLRKHLGVFPDTTLTSEDYEEAALFYNKCRQQGIQGANTDFLICSVAARRKMAILTSDKDFEHYARVLPITLHNRK